MTDQRNDLPPSPLTWAYAEAWAEEDPQVIGARRQAEQLGAPSIGKATGSLLRLITAMLGAEAVVEVGSGTGVSGGWILAGMGEHGVLTTVDRDPELQAAARDTFIRMGVPHTRVRTIAGDPLDVLSRLTDGAYDLLVVGTDADDEHGILAEAHRLLRPGGCIAITQALSDDGSSAAHRDLAQHLRDDPEWTSSLLTVGEGVLVAVRRAADVDSD